VVLVGGSLGCRWCAAGEALFGKGAAQPAQSDEVVRWGRRCRPTSWRRDHDMLLLDVTPLSLGIEPWAAS